MGCIWHSNTTWKHFSIGSGRWYSDNFAMLGDGSFGKYAMLELGAVPPNMAKKRWSLATQWRGWWRRPRRSYRCRVWMTRLREKKTGFPGLLFWKEELGQTWYDGDLFIDDFEWCWSMLIYFDLFCSIFMVVAGCFCYKATRYSILWWSTWSKTTISRETAGGHASLAGFPPRTGSSDLGARGQAAASQLMFVVTRGDLHF